jgi:hypothetical protein
MPGRPVIYALCLSLFLSLPVVSPAACTPTVEISEPSPGEIRHEANVTVTGTAWGTDFWCNHTNLTDMTGNCTCAVIMGEPDPGVALQRGLYDDFNDDSLNKTAWTASSCDMNVSEADGVLIMNGSATKSDWNSYAMVSTPKLGYTDFSADIQKQNYSGGLRAYIELYQDNTHWVRFGYYFDQNAHTEAWYYYHMDGTGGGGGYHGAQVSGLHNVRIMYDNATGTAYMYGDGVSQDQEHVTLGDHECRLVTSVASANDSAEARFDNVWAGYCVGYYFSEPIDAKLLSPELWHVNWTPSTSGSSSASVQLRSSDTPDMDDPTSWTTIDNHGNCTSLTFNRYIQYKVTLKCLAPGASPVFQSISIQVYIAILKVEVSLNDVNWIVADGTTSWSVTMAVPDGNRTISCRATDAMGDIAKSSVTMIMDTVPPSGSLVINDGGTYAGEPQVSLTVGWSGPVEVTKMYISNSPIFIVDDWMPYQNVVEWNLSDGDGQKRVYCIVCDRYGLISSRIIVNVTLDTVPPTGSLKIDDGAQMTRNAQVRVAVAASDEYGVEDMQLSNTAGFEGAEWMPFANEVAWDLTAGPGAKTVFLRVRDHAGHLSPVVSRSIVRIAEGGTGPLPVANMTVNEGSGFATERPVTIHITVDGGAAFWMMLSNDGEFTGCKWDNFRDSVSWNIPELDGKKTIYGRFATGEGRIFSARGEVILDTMPPEGNVGINGGEPDALSASVRLDIGGKDLNGVSMMMVSNSPDFSGARWEPYCTQRNWTLTGGDGNKQVYVAFRDPAGLVSEPAMATIILDTDRPVPTGKVTINAGISFTNSTSVSLSLVLNESSLARYARVMISNSEDFSGAAWEKFHPAKEWDLLPGDGNKTVYVIFEANRMRCDPVSDTIVLDTVAPELPVLDKYDPSISKRSIRLSGAAEPSTSLSIAGIPVAVGLDGRFSAEIPLEKGDNNINIVITDPAGNSNGEEITVERVEFSAQQSVQTWVWAAIIVAVFAVMVLALAGWRFRARKLRPAPENSGDGKAP